MMTFKEFNLFIKNLHRKLSGTPHSEEQVMREIVENNKLLFNVRIPKGEITCSVLNKYKKEVQKRFFYESLKNYTGRNGNDRIYKMLKTFKRFDHMIISTSHYNPCNGIIEVENKKYTKQTLYKLVESMINKKYWDINTTNKGVIITHKSTLPGIEVEETVKQDIQLTVSDATSIINNEISKIKYKIENFNSKIKELKIQKEEEIKKLEQLKESIKW